MRFKLIKRLGLILSNQKDKTFLFVKRTANISPDNLSLYRLAFTHKSYTASRETFQCNERLEFLGDAILDSIVSDVLYKRFPHKTEGELTQYRSNIVKRKSLNKIALSLNFEQMLIADPNANISDRIYGDMLEAFVGALYLDKGYRAAFYFVKKRITNKLISSEDFGKNCNFKSQLLEWGQHSRKKIIFTEEKENDEKPIFYSKVSIDGQEVAQGEGKTKKDSHNNAALKAIKMLEEKGEHILDFKL